METLLRACTQNLLYWKNSGHANSCNNSSKLQQQQQQVSQCCPRNAYASDFDFVVSRQMSTTHDKLRTTEAPMQHVCGDATNAIIDINSFQSAGYGYFFPSIELLAVVAPKVLQQPWQQR